MQHVSRDRPGLAELLLADGRPLLGFTALALILSGLFAIFIAATGELLPHDAAYLGMPAGELCAVADCRILYFMIHDRVAFGGALIGIGVLYGWLVIVPLGERQAWSWWALVLSGTVGFASFLAYLGYGYLDTWHGIATLVLLPCFLTGLVLSYRNVRPGSPWEAFRHPRKWGPARSRMLLGQAGLLLTALGISGAGLVILLAGTTRVFVPQDLEYMQLQMRDICAISPRLVPLIAHDRAGFGGALAATGLTIASIVWKARPTRLLWESLLVAGLAGFGCAIAIHWLIGYLNIVHLLPAYTGTLLFALSLWLARSPFWLSSG
jgi:hypothetical protein